VALVMEADAAANVQRVSIMTLHGAKGLEFETVFLPGWEEGLFPHQRSLDDNGRAGLEEERRLAYVGITRAKRRAKIFFATNRRIHGLWQSTMPSRFIDNLPTAHVEVVESAGASQYGAYGVSRFANLDSYGSGYTTPGWKRAQTAQKETASRNARASGARPTRQPTVIEGEILGRSSATARFSPGARVMHMKFGPGTVASADGAKLTVDFDKAGRKMVLESFVERT
jgi:DNA helicase-2/ATP-dependent DNA helicase PcrA